jgi:hypothetical protein
VAAQADHAGFRKGSEDRGDKSTLIGILSVRREGLLKIAGKLSM